MKKIRKPFELYNGDPRIITGYQEITTSFIFDIKLGEKFWIKDRLVGDGHNYRPPSSETYLSVVSRYSVRVYLLIAAFNDLKMFVADI